ncbi:MAG: nucleotide exchange factor GrpE [Thermoguttaceae bacterium]
MTHRHSPKHEQPHSAKSQGKPADSEVKKEPAEEACATPSFESSTAAHEAASPSGEIAEQLRSELEEARQRILRSQAELDNYRKRAARELDDQLRYANLPLLRDLLPVIDNMQRAIEAAEKTDCGGGLLDGVKLVYQQLADVLKQHHCLRIEAINAPFDPHLHHAILQQPSEEHPENTVLLVTQEGYQLYDRVVRPSQVIVSTTK